MVSEKIIMKYEIRKKTKKNEEKFGLVPFFFRFAPLKKY